MVFRFKNLGHWLRKLRIKDELGGTWPLAKKIKKSSKFKNLRRKKMKKLIAVAAILSVMFLGTGTSQAFVGVPDAVPGTDIMVPFFLVSMPGFGNENTLITLTDVTGAGWPNTVLWNTNVFYWVHDIDSVVQWDGTFNLTPFDVWGTDALTMITGMSVAAKAALEIDLDGDGTNDHWAGYIYFFNQTYINDNLMAHAYQVAIPEGMAAGYIPPSMEFCAPWLLYDPRQVSLMQIGGAIFDVEAFSANALWVGKNLLAGLVAPVNDAGFFRLMPRYYIHDANSVNYLIIWTESNFSNIPLPGTNIHVFFFDEEENRQSSNIDLDHELNIIDVAMVVPAGLFPAGYPYAGWINIETPDIFANGWFTDVNIPGGDGIWDGAQREWVSYSYQKAIGSAAETWDVIFEMHRDADGT